MLYESSNNKSSKATKDFILIHLSGEVKNPGVYKIKKESRLVDLLKLAGGVTPRADIDIINLVQPLADGQKISVPSKQKFVVSSTSSLSKLKVNINFATLERLKSLPGIGESLAKRIVDFRTKNGFFKNASELKKVSGIGNKLFEKIKDNIIL